MIKAQAVEILIYDNITFNYVARCLITATLLIYRNVYDKKMKKKKNKHVIAWIYVQQIILPSWFLFSIFFFFIYKNLVVLSLVVRKFSRVILFYTFFFKVAWVLPYFSYVFFRLFFFKFDIEINFFGKKKWTYPTILSTVN